jgi:deoxyuridine 5'-triphosphate nucleotidohydrolase
MNDTPVFKFNLIHTVDFQLLPSRGTPKSTGWDVKVSVEKIVARPGQHIKIPLGFRVFAPQGWWLELRPRSSTFAKKQLNALYGVIDEDYEGECMFACQYLPDIKSLGTDLTLNYGDAIGQMVPIKRQEMIVEDVSDEEFARLCKERNAARGAGGFGSTGA